METSIELGDQKGKYTHLVRVAEPHGKKKDFLPGKYSASERPWTLFTRPLPTSFSSL